MSPHQPSVLALRERLTYYPETGVFVWKASRCARMVPGTVAGKVDRRGCIDIGFDNVQYKAHRVAWAMMTGSWPTLEIDHIDGNPSNNAWSNLRQVDRFTNNQNRIKASRNSKSGLLGAFYSKAVKKWCAKIMVRRQSITIGYYETPEAAHQAYLEAKRTLHEGCTI